MTEVSPEVRWTEGAIRDLEAIAAYIANDSPANARRVTKRLRDLADSLCELPLRGRVVPELAAFGIREWRELVDRPWRLVYRTSKRAVDVIAVVDSRRSVEDVLLRRLLDG